jgi:hypothetical protein
MNPRSTIRGTVERFGERQINILVANTEELRAFYRQHAPGRNLEWAESPHPKFTASRADLVGRCKPGDEVEYLVELRSCKDGPRAYGLELQVVRAA